MTDIPEVKDIFLTPDNVLEFQEDDVHSRAGQKCLDRHMELNDALSNATSQNIDAGSEYALWLNSIGISHQTDKGWWNETAVDKDNMQAFVDYWHSEQGNSLVDLYIETKEKISALPKNVKVSLIERHTNVREHLGA